MSFSKLTVIIVGVHIIFSYYFYNFLKRELKSAPYVSLINKTDLFDFPWKKLKVYQGDIYLGYLTNWDDKGFHLLNDGEKLNNNKKQILQVRFEGHDFNISTSLAFIGKDGESAGFYVRDEGDKPADRFNWSELYAILCNMGYEVGLLK
jgi:hypothetical protein